MLNFEERIGPDFGANQPEYPRMDVPEWYRDAKFGIFIHWGIYSVPSWALVHGERAPQPEELYAHHQYAEWYANTVRIPGSPTRQHHVETYGPGTSYEDLLDHWSAEKFDAAQFTSQLLSSGARYVVPVTKHHDGCCLWDTATTPFNTVRRGPGRDIIQELHDAVRATNTKFGLYFSGALDWHVSDQPAIRSGYDLFMLRRNDEDFSRYAAAQLRELIARFSPDLLWNDIEWPDLGKSDAEFGVANLWREYLQHVPHGTVNDRWGVPAHGFLTREYSHVDGILEQPWEACRGLGQSFGYNHLEDENASMSGADAIRFLVDVVSKNGNLLLNVGPRADGTIPELQLEALRSIGAWLATNGKAIFGTRPWIRYGDGAVRYTQRSGRVYCLILEPETTQFTLPAELRDRDVAWLGSTATGTEIPADLRQQPVAVAHVAA